MFVELEIAAAVFVFVMTNCHLKNKYEKQRIAKGKVVEKFYEIHEKTNPFHPYAVEAVSDLEPDTAAKFNLVVEINGETAQVAVQERLFREVGVGEIVETHYHKRLPGMISIEKVLKIKT